jgi:P27 family predicted phage terminase small subunit
VPNKRQKPADKLQGHRKGPATLEVVKSEQPKVPKVPKGLHPVARKAWKSFWTSPIAQVVDRDADWEAICRWAYCLSERELLEDELRAHPLVLGSQGQRVRNPLFDILKERTREIEKFREQFGLAPLHRMRLGITYNEADEALDRMNKRRQNFEPVMVEVTDDDSDRESS